MDNIVITGFMGAGKSTVARRLARELGFGLVDTDEEVEKVAGISVSAIFERFGEARFRELEREVVASLVSGRFGDGLVVSAGGGLVADDESRRALRRWSTVVCLDVSVDEILKRVGGAGERPLLATGGRRDEVERLLKERKAAYDDCDFRVDTTGRSVEEVVRAIEAALGERERGRHNR